MKKLLLFFCIFVQTGFSQKDSIDIVKRDLTKLSVLSEGIGKDTLVYANLKWLMRSYVDVNIDSSISYNKRLINLCRNPTMQRELIYAYQYAGYLYQIKGNHYQSILYHYKALPIAEQLGQFSRAAVSYGALAHAYSSLKEYRKATQLCRKGLDVLSKHSDPGVQLSILNVLGVIYREQGKLSDALKVNLRMYQIAQRDHDTWYESHGLHSIGLVYKEMGNFGDALKYHRKALIISQKTGSIELEGNILINMADIYVRQQDWVQALKYATLAKKVAVRVENSNIVMETEQTLYKIFKGTKKPNEALQAYERSVFLRDSLSRETQQQRIDMLQAQYDNVEKTNALQQEKVNSLAEKNKNLQLAKTRDGLYLGIGATLVVAVLLFLINRRLQVKNSQIRKQQTQLEIAKSELAESNKTLESRVQERTAELMNANRQLVRKNEEIKLALFKGQTIERKRVAIELHDNLSSLLSAVNMSVQSINTENLSKSEQVIYVNVKKLIQNAYAEVRNISHNILPAELESQGLICTLTTLVEQLNQSLMFRFVLSVTGFKERLPVEIEFNVYSIVLELINNAIKHSKASHVEIVLIRNPYGVSLSISDDGVGFEESTAKRGVGLQNIQTRLEMLGGTFEIMQPTNKGVRIDIEIPIEIVQIKENISIA